MLVRTANSHGTPRYVNPVPGGTLGRTDQGVDVSAPAGTPIYAITNETLVGIIQNWYNGQPFYWFKQAGSNVYNYVAEQISSRLKPGDTVQAGQQIGTVAPSGTGLELGYATASGQTLARATTGYTEGEATPAGKSYRANVFGNAATPTGTSSRTSLEQLWIDAGGPPGVAQTMAAIALAESGGQVGAVNSSSGAAGLWQILPSAHPQFNVSRLTSDPMYNAKAAVAVYKSQGFGAWSTYTSGAYQQYLNQAASASVNYGGPNGGIVRPGGQPAGQSSSDISSVLQSYTTLRDMPRTAPPGTKNPAAWWLASFTGNWDSLAQSGQGS